MKNIILILFLLPTFCKAQFQTEPVSKGMDTIKVMLLMGNTEHDFVLRKPPLPNIWWGYGYSVREKFCCVNGNNKMFAVYQPVPYYEHRYYLDENKKPLPKNIIVWEAK